MRVKIFPNSKGKHCRAHRDQNHTETIWIQEKEENEKKIHEEPSLLHLSSPNLVGCNSYRF